VAGRDPSVAAHLMLAALCSTYGSPEVVAMLEVTAPDLMAGHVRVRIVSAAVNFPDVLLVAGGYQIKVLPPFIPGSEFAGEVVELGEGVSELVLGQHVFGTTLVGAFAQEVVVRPGALTPVPPGIDIRLASAFGVAHRTAYHVLRSVASIQPGEELVVLGAGGGVGLACVQLGTLLGASVTAVASSAEKLEVAASLGATRLVDRRDGDLREALRGVVPEGADVVVDPVGGDLSEPALRSLRWGGRFVTVGYASGSIPRIPLNLVLLKGVKVLGFQIAAFMSNAPDQHRRDEAELADLLASGQAFPHIGAAFGLSEVGAALAHVADGQAVGKVIIGIA
jgi:NADPH2:quinone reductase